LEVAIAIGGITVPDSKRVRDIAEIVRDPELPLLFHHSSRVFYRGALTYRPDASARQPQ
jgi:hypothetical protein